VITFVSLRGKKNNSPAIYKDYPGLMRLSTLKFSLSLPAFCFFS